MVKCNILFLAFLISSIFCISPIFADVIIDLNLPIDNFLTSDTTPDFNFTYTGDEPVAFCAVYVNGFVYGNLYEWCYQESANVSTVCGGLDTGGYSCEGTWSLKGCDFVYDGDWGDCGVANNSCTATAYMTYIIPNNSLKTSLWKLQYDNNKTNNSITNGCFNGNTLQFRVFSSVNDNSSDSRSTWYCWDYDMMAWWAIIGWTDWENGNGIICEEAIWWNMVTTNATNNTPTIITADPPLTAGIYDWYVNCTANGIMNQSEVRTLVIFDSPECPECNDSCLSEWQNQTIYDIYNQTGLIYNFNVTNTMNPSFVLWILIFLGSTMALLYGMKIKKVAYLVVSTVLYLTLSVYSFSFIEVIGDAGTWIMIGISVFGFSVGLLYTLQAVVILLKESSEEPKEVVKL